MKNIFLLLFCFLFPVTSFAAEAVIDGQTRVKPGVMFVLNYEGSKGDHFKWLTDPSIEALPEEDRPQPLICGTQYGLALINPGTYYFTLIAADEEGISVAVHTLEIVGKSPTPPPTEPPLPEKPTEVAKRSAEEARKLNDPVTAKRLATAMKAVKSTGDLSTTKSLVRQAVETVLLTRDDKERSIPWINWRTAVDEEIDVDTEEEYLQTIKAVIQGLEEVVSSKSARGPPKLVVYTIPNCAPCSLWKQNELPKFLGWDIEFRTATSGSVPRFIVNGTVLQGYQTYTQILSSQE